FEGEPVDRVAPMHYQGQILGVSGSWVRLSWVNGLPEGMIRIGHQLLLIDYDPMLGELLATELLDEHAELDQRPPDSPVSSAALSENLKVLPLSIVLDTLYNEAHDGLGLERALTIVNAVDGLYQEQLGLRLELRTVRLLIDPGADPMRRLSGDIDELLNVFRRFRLGDVTIARGQGAVHLFSGAKLADKRVGLAYIDTICRSDGYDVGVSRVVDRDVFTFAHELAHNLGAEHDLDTQCGDDGRMMNATLRSDMQYAFSACSVKSIRRGMQRTCVLDQPALQFAAAGLDEADSVVD
ncbi:MAG: M12 family metallo-peptidase, partial [Granulosicoccaceae bacterium]